MRSKFVVALLLVCVSSPSWTGNKSKKAQIGIIQYNVKGGQGGWTTAHGVIDAQVRLIVDQVNASSVDFIALEQASERAGSPDPLISVSLAKNGLPGWNTIVTACNLDATQLAFSSNWELVNDPVAQNPLLNAASPQRGWIVGGCERGDGRPYNLAYFRNKKTMFKVLVVVAHFPHCTESSANCASYWNLAKFHEDIKTVIGASSVDGINLIAAGDFNELGDRGDPSIFEHFLPGFGKLNMSPELRTCCSDSSWVYRFDRIVTNSSNTPTSAILKDGSYPLNPTYSGPSGEHKAIYGEVNF
jgi:hypothetical protein